MRPLRRPSLLCIIFLLCALRPAAQIVNIEEMRIQGTNDSLRWYGAAKANLNLSKVREKSLLLGSDARIQYKQHRHIALLLLNAQMLRAGQQDYIRSGFAHLRYNYKLNASLSAELFVQKQTNRLLLIRDRSLAGAGLRRRFFLNYRQNSRLYLGVSYLYEHNDFTADYAARRWHRLSQYLTLTLRHKKTGALLQTTTYWQPVIGLIKNYRFSTEWTLELPIVKHLRYAADFSYSIDQGLPAAAPLQVYTWTNGLVWRW